MVLAVDLGRMLFRCDGQSTPALAIIVALWCECVQLATVISGSGTIPHLVACLKHSDAKLKRQAANSLAQVCKHNVDLAEVAVEAGMFPA